MTDFANIRLAVLAVGAVLALAGGIVMGVALADDDFPIEESRQHSIKYQVAMPSVVVVLLAIGKVGNLQVSQILALGVALVAFPALVTFADQMRKFASIVDSDDKKKPIQKAMGGGAVLVVSLVVSFLSALPPRTETAESLKKSIKQSALVGALLSTLGLGLLVGNLHSLKDMEYLTVASYILTPAMNIAFSAGLGLGAALWVDNELLDGAAMLALGSAIATAGSMALVTKKDAEFSDANLSVWGFIHCIVGMLALFVSVVIKWRHKLGAQGAQSTQSMLPYSAMH